MKKQYKITAFLLALCLLLSLCGCIGVGDRTPAVESEPHTHSWGNLKIAADASCSAGGKLVAVCSGCGETESYDTSPTVHNFGEWQRLIEPTCTDEGTIARSCTECGETESRPLLAVGHTRGALVEDSAKNERVALCTVCGDVAYTETIYTEFSEGLEFTLSKDGRTYAVSGLGTCTDSVVVIPASYEGKLVTSIAYNAFNCVKNVKSVIIPNSVVKIDQYAFAYSDIESVRIPGSVGSIGQDAFAGCENLTSVIIPDSVASLGSDAFMGCTNLKSVTLSKNIKTIAYGTFRRSGIESILIPEGVNLIGDSAFKECPALKNVSIPSSVTVLGEFAFAGCESLSYVILPESVKLIDNGLFHGCKSLESVSFSDGVTSIGYNAFFDCTSLRSFRIPSGISELKYSTYNSIFTGCDSLVSFEVDPDNETYYSEGNCIINKETKTIVVGCNGSYILSDSGIVAIGERAFSGCRTLENILIPDTVTSIGDYAFSGCIGLRSLKLPDSVTNLGMAAFSACDSLTEFVIPDSIYDIPPSLLNSCKSLKSVTFGKSVRSFGHFALHGCESLETLVLPEGIGTITATEVFADCPSLRSLTIPASLTMFYGSIFIGSGDNLTEIIISPDNSSYYTDGSSVIKKKDGTIVIGAADGSIPTDTSVKSIGAYAFCGRRAITEIRIPKNINYIGVGAFELCENVTSITYEGTIAEWSEVYLGEDWFTGADIKVVHCSDGDTELKVERMPSMFD